LSDTLLPELTAEQLNVWKIAGSERGQLLVLSEQAFYFCDLSIEDLDEQENALLHEGIPPDVVLTESNKVKLKDIISVRGDEKRLTMEIRYACLTGGASFEATLPSRELQDDIFTAFRARFGAKCKYHRKVMSAGRALVAPVVAVCLSLGAAYFMAYGGGLESTNATGRNRAMKAILMKLLVAVGPAGVLAIGVVVAGCCAWWGVRRYKNPPIQVNIRP
jgi:hypothetical protein